VVDSENPALARPATISELKRRFEEERELIKGYGWPVERRMGWRVCYETFLHWLEDLDQGPIAQPLSEQQLIEQELFELHLRNQQ